MKEGNSMELDVVITHPAFTAVATGLLARWQEEDARYYALHPTRMPGGGYAGFWPVGKGGRWLTSGGNYAALFPVGEGWRLTVLSRRHGLPLGVREVLRTIWPGSVYETPDVADRRGKGTQGLGVRATPYGRDRVIVLRYATQEPAWAPWATAEMARVEDDLDAEAIADRVGPLAEVHTVAEGLYAFRTQGDAWGAARVRWGGLHEATVEVVPFSQLRSEDRNRVRTWLGARGLYTVSL